MNIRKAVPGDAQELKDLYFEHLTSTPPKEEQKLSLWREKLAAFEKDEHYHLLVGEIEGKIVSSVTLVIIENLTHNMRPYALIENVVTHADYRGRHYAAALMSHAGAVAKEFGCYKIMLLTGSKKESTWRFYENCGFNRHEKTAFHKKL